MRAIACILIAWNIFMFARLFMLRTSTRRGTIFLVFQMYDKTRSDKSRVIKEYS